VPRPSPEALPDELVLRELLDLDPGDDDALLGFLCDYGIITEPEPEPASARLGVPGPENRPKGRLHIEEVRDYLRRAQALVWHWLAEVDDEHVMPAWERAGIARETPNVKPSAFEDLAWSWFTGTLNAGLRGLPPHVMSYGEWTGERVEYGEPTVDLFTALCVQLFNVMVEDLPIRTCANENCGRRFVRQRGRAEHGQYRTEGVHYCSKNCAKAQGERDRRAQRRKEKR
jgi:hypothetical protein